MRLNKNFKKALSAVLASAMVFSFAPVVNADEAEPGEPAEEVVEYPVSAGETISIDFSVSGSSEFVGEKVFVCDGTTGSWNPDDIKGNSVKITEDGDYTISYAVPEGKDAEENPITEYVYKNDGFFSLQVNGITSENVGDFKITVNKLTIGKYTATFTEDFATQDNFATDENYRVMFYNTWGNNYKFLAAPKKPEFKPFQMYIGGNFNSGWNQEFTGDAKLGSKDAGDADDGYYLDITEPGDYTFKFIASENVANWSVAYINIPTFHTAQEFFDAAKVTWKDITVKNADETEELAKYPFVKDQSLMFCYWDGEPAKGVRYNLTNEYNKDCAYLNDVQEAAAWEGEVTAPEDKDKDKSYADFVELVPTRASDYLPSEITYSANDVVEINFTVEAGDGVIPSAGITEATEDMTTTPAFEATEYPESGDEPGTDPTPTVTPSTTPTAPATTPAVTNTPAPKKVTTTAAVTTPSAASLKVAKKVVVAAGKTKDVKVTVDPSTFSAITATSANEKLVTVATAAGVVKVTATAAAKKNKGKVVKVTVKAGDKEQIVKVAIQNKAKKLKAAKKVVTVKKGKKAKVTFKVTAENKKAAATDLFAKAAKAAKKAAKIAKVAKVQSVKVKKGKAIVTIKATKKTGTKPLTLKLGKAKAKCKVTVK